jgi:O-antigen/teichoic acid export membrane protein
MIGTFTKNTLITFITRVLVLASGVGISIIIARALGPEGKGVYALAILLPGLLVTFTNLGINPATVFYVAKKRESAREIFGNNILLTALISAIAVLIGLVIIFGFGDKLFPGIAQNYLLLALLLIPLPLFFEFISHILVGLQKFTTYNAIHLLQSLLFIMLVGILLLVFSFGISAAILAQVGALLLTGGILFFFVWKEAKGISLRPRKEYLKGVSLYGLKAHLSAMISFLHLRADLFMINIFLNPLAAGFYSIAVGISEGMWLISRSVGTVLFPKVAAETDPETLKSFTPLVCRNVLLVAIMLAVVLLIFSHWIVVWLYSEEFLASIQPLRILLIGSTAYCGYSVLAYDFMARGKPMLISYIAGASLVLNIILNAIWIPIWGISGAAWATSVSYTAMFIITIYIYGRVSGNKVWDVIIPRKADFRYYKNLLSSLKSLLLPKERV